MAGFKSYRNGNQERAKTVGDGCIIYNAIINDFEISLVRTGET